eukprot:4723080-Amphidinium_carterae.1
MASMLGTMVRTSVLEWNWLVLEKCRWGGAVLLITVPCVALWISSHVARARSLTWTSGTVDLFQNRPRFDDPIVPSSRGPLGLHNSVVLGSLMRRGA